MVDAVAQRYGKRPSEILAIEDDITKFDFDCSIIYRMTQIREKGSKMTPDQELNNLKMQFAAAGLTSFERGNN